MKKKGFTLIELLAVIVILSVIALIATPLIMGTITKAKKNAFIDTAYGIIKAGENYQMNQNLDSPGYIPDLVISDLTTDTKLVYKGTKPKSGKLIINRDGQSAIAIWSGQFCARKGFTDKVAVVDDKIKTSDACISSAFQMSEFDSIKKMQKYTVPETGIYYIELWGAAGNSVWDGIPGNGAYTSGYIKFTKGETYYVYVGSYEQAEIEVGYNGSKNIQSGGGATDIRLTSGNWYDFNSLKTRIMVAAGGGGAERVKGGAGGGLTGYSGTGIYAPSLTNGTGGTQTSGGLPGTGSDELSNQGEKGYFGLGGSGCVSCRDRGPGGGGGYYGGGSISYAGGSGGGSSFISGYPGCDAILESSTESNIIHTGQPNHYSGKIFTNPVMIDGLHTMPNPRGVGNIKGNPENGYARITLVSVNS